MKQYTKSLLKLTSEKLELDMKILTCLLSKAEADEYLKEVMFICKDLRGELKDD